MRSRAADIVGRVSLYSVTFFLIALAAAALTSLLILARPDDAARLLGLHRLAVAGTFGFGLLFFLNVMICHRFFVPHRVARSLPLEGARVHAGLTAYNDEEAIGRAVDDFRQTAPVHRVVVVDNNSKDATAQVARQAGAEVVIETRPGYGACCMRAMAEAARGADVVVLCEGDMTFSGRDVAKLLAYLENCDLVLGTRATQELREPGTQMDWLINPANQVVAKLIQIRFWGTRLTDVGCTYRAIRAEAYRKVAPALHVTGSHFSPHMTIEALKLGLSVIEIPIYFRKRVGESKGVGSNKLRAARVAMAMLRLLYVS
jgi:hypothetical protein